MRETGFDIYLVTDRRLTGGGEGLIRAVGGALEGGIKGVQLREKDLAGGELLELAQRLRELTASYGAKLLINDRVDVALSAGGEARKLMKEALIGVSTHSLKEALEAETGGADFITLGPVYQTPSKKEYGEPIGLGPLKEVTRALSIPVFAIGGIKKDLIKEVLSSGAFGAAVISAVLGSSDVRKSAEELAAELALGPKKGEHTELV
jgi:thiamine-phosphate pyrophosphorylase